MGRKKKFTEDDLLEAVVLYSEIEKGKIKATELAKWANDNVPGMEGVKDYNFMRPVMELLNGKKTRPSYSKQRIDEINKSREAADPGQGNALLNAANISDVLSMSSEAIRQLIIRTREDYYAVVKENAEIRNKNLTLREDNNVAKNYADLIDNKFKNLEKKFNDIQHNLKYLTNLLSDNERREAIKKWGAEDGLMSLVRYRDSLSVDESELLDIGKEMKKYRKIFEKEDVLPIEDKADNNNSSEDSNALTSDSAFKKLLTDI